MPVSMPFPWVAGIDRLKNKQKKKKQHSRVATANNNLSRARLERLNRN